MSRERPGSPRTRLFLALDLPREVRSSLAAWRDDALAAHGEVRLIPEEYLHVTLVFLGWQYERDIDRIASAAFEPLAGLPQAGLAARGLVPVPKRGPRLFALDLEDPSEAATGVQAAAATRLAEGGFHEPEKRPFWPHVTLARVKRGRRAPRVEAPDPPGKPFEASVVTLYRSVLRPQGAQYEPLHRHTLG